MTPRATYRLQLHAGFGFDDAAAVVPYLARLGISHLYCSPILQAARGSMHGYDVVDHSHLNDELGGASGFERLSRAAENNDLAIVVDVVPNHMALAGASNRWWWDVLEYGPASPYAEHFDIDWTPLSFGDHPQVLMPVLGDHYGRVLEAGDLRLDRQGGTFLVRCHEQALPLGLVSLTSLLRAAARRVEAGSLTAIADALEETRPDLVGGESVEHHRIETLRQQLRDLTAAEPSIADALDDELASLARDPDAVDELLSRQSYRLAYWRVASDELDYRRFFDITSLVGLRAESPVVFDDTHRCLLELVGTGDVVGLRIDHVDGLRDPAGYLHRLRAAAPGTWIVVEKILAPDERLPEEWPVAGTTGYDFADRVSDLFVDRHGVDLLVKQFQAWTGEPRSFGSTAHAAQLDVMSHELAAEVERVTELLMGVCHARRRHRDHTRRELRTVIKEIVAALEVYRTYVVAGQEAGDVDRRRIAHAVARVAELRPDTDGELLGLLERILILDEPGTDAAEFAARFQQLTSPVTAKGIEDTAFYRWTPLLSRNEVGSDPAHIGRGVESFHEHNTAIAQRWPATMLALSTHDTKRSADVRARLNVLTQLAPPWIEATEGWREHNRRHRAEGWDDPGIELALYQTVVGAWPVEVDRVEATLVKSAREAKLRTSWRDVDPVYEEDLSAFVRGVMADEQFQASVEEFLNHHDLVARGRVASLAQLALELTSPGVPDTYQGDELWDLSLVDPDNRRPVDYERRESLLAECAGLSVEAVGKRSDDGSPKLWLLHRLLQHRRAAPERYRTQEYAATQVSGSRAHHVVAFARDGLMTVVPRLVVGLEAGWADTTLALGESTWVDVLSGATHRGSASLDDLLGRFPVAVLERQDP